MENLAKQVKIMRDLQKEYFKTRDKVVLSKSKAQERIVDQMIKNIESAQQSIF